MKTNLKKSGPGGYHVNVWGRPTVLMAEEGAGGGSGSGGGSGTDGDELTRRINEVVHKALTEREKRLDKKIEEKLSGISNSLSEKISLLSDKLDTSRNESGEKSKESPSETAAQLAAMSKEMKELRASNDELKKKAQESESRAIKTEELNTLTQLVTGAVKAPLLDMTVATLHSRVTRDKETGAILFKGDDGEFLPIKDGIEAWKKTEQAKELAPPREVKGAGDKGGQNTGKTTPGAFGFADLGSMIGGKL